MIALDLDRVVFDGAAGAALGFEFLRDRRELVGCMLKPTDNGHGFTPTTFAGGLNPKVLLLGRPIGHSPFEGCGVVPAKFSVDDRILLSLVGGF